jgi:hypothetical protein
MHFTLHVAARAAGISVFPSLGHAIFSNSLSRNALAHI